MGLCVVSQRPAKIDKNVLSQCNTQIILKVTNPNDLKAIVGSVEGLTSESADEIARLPVGVALVAGGSLGMPVMVEVRTRQSRHGGASVDIIGGEAQKPVPRMKKALVYEERTDLPPRPTANGDTSGKASPPRKEEKAKVKAKEGGGVSDRSIQWGTRAEAAPSPEAPRTDPGPSSTTPAEAPPARTAPTAASTPSIVHEVSAKDLRKTNEVPTMNRPSDEPPRAMEPRDVRIHRVANRSGYVATLRPEETLDLLRKAAARGSTQPNTYLEIFAKVGRTHCFRDAPDCPPCPLAGKCAYKAKQDQRGAKEGKGVLGKFFGRR
jgi:hypothetical protein